MIASHDDDDDNDGEKEEDDDKFRKGVQVHKRAGRAERANLLADDGVGLVCGLDVLQCGNKLCTVYCNVT